MRIKLIQRLFLFTVYLVCSIQCLFSQEFERIESALGFEKLADNNGVAVADYDGDLDLDIFIVAKNSESPELEKSYSRLYRNDLGVFTDVTDSAGLLGLFSSNLEFAGLQGDKFGVSWGDYDNDGYPDIFFTYISSVQLFHNKGDGTFEDVTDISGITVNQACKNTGATWFDYNNDGFLDIYINDWGGCESNSLFKNNGDGTFLKISIQSLVEIAGGKELSFTMIPFDFNNDGWLDLYVANDFGTSNNLFINQDGNSFVENVSEVTPLAASGKGNWSIVDFSTEEAGGEGPTNGYATAAIDGDSGTFWHSNWSSTGSSYPHHLTIDMGEEKSIAGFEIFTRRGDSRGATVHEFWVSSDNVTFTQVATLNAALDLNDGSYVAADAVTTGRYVKYVATAGPNSFTFLGELNVIESLDSSDWSIVDFSTEEAGGEGPVNGFATAAIDGDPGTFWHSNWSSTGSSYPHHVTIDLGSEKGIAGFEIFTRRGDSRGATVHEFWVSNDNVNFTQVATLSAALDPNDGYIVNSDVITTGRYVKYIATEGPNSFTFLGEIRVFGAIN